MVPPDPTGLGYSGIWGAPSLADTAYGLLGDFTGGRSYAQEILYGGTPVAPVSSSGGAARFLGQGAVGPFAAPTAPVAGTDWGSVITGMSGSVDWQRIA